MAQAVQPVGGGSCRSRAATYLPYSRRRRCWSLATIPGCGPDLRHIKSVDVGGRGDHKAVADPPHRRPQEQGLPNLGCRKPLGIYSGRSMVSSFKITGCTDAGCTTKREHLSCEGSAIPPLLTQQRTASRTSRFSALYCTCVRLARPKASGHTETARRRCTEWDINYLNSSGRKSCKSCV